MKNPAPRLAFDEALYPVTSKKERFDFSAEVHNCGERAGRQGESAQETRRPDGKGKSGMNGKSLPG
jgi:hypothetical protein